MALAHSRRAHDLPGAWAAQETSYGERVHSTERLTDGHDGPDAVPVSFGQLLQLTPLIHTRVVDQDVQPAKLRDSRRDRRT
jgi:hypothetical protein